MCGIAGIVGEGAREHQQCVQQMVDALAHRGPDGSGIYIAPSGACVLGQTRLAILDLSDAAAQPMLSSDQRHALVYNGECYNFRALREELLAQGVSFNSNGDTQVLLQLFIRDGERAFPKLNAMFALAFWDEEARRLLLGRDRYGQKPLYFFETRGLLLFASEVRALLASGLVPRRQEPAAVASYLAYGSVQEPHTIVQGVYSLPPKSYATWSAAGYQGPHAYWEPAHNKILCSPQEVRASFVAAIERHLISDAPLGLFLSGGIDSSAVAAAAARTTTGTLKTLSMIYPDQPELSEERYAQEMATQLRTEHHAIPITGPELLKMLPDAIASLDQPTGDSINTYMVSQAAHSCGLKVALSGLGGDELFGGYSSFRLSQTLQKVRRLVGPAGSLIAKGLRKLMPDSQQANKLSELLSQDTSLLAAYLSTRRVFSSHQIASLAPALQRTAPPYGLEPSWVEELQSWIKQRAPEDAISLLELRTYMSQTLLRDSDVMGMRHSLEIRVPFLDTEFSSLALALPSQTRRPTPRPKWLLIEAMGDWLPRTITHRKKQGFTFPFQQWMQHSLRAEIEASLDVLPTRCPMLQHKPILDLWKQFLQHPQRVGWYRPWVLSILGRYLENHQLTL